ncbi:hypothetical protein BX600DRAFT_444189 [Xylariales sp. PMI_506]|nr:hypothetical protein BX600DRAFT_444189 [Xylariales sp. PMI_506]
MAAPASAAAKALSNAMNQARIVGRQLYQSQTAVVVSAGKMDRTVKVRLWGQRWEKKVQKSFQVPIYHLVHDPNNSVREGDVVSISAGWRTSQHKRHVVRQIIAPHGPPIDERPPVPTDAELMKVYEVQREAKLERRAARDAERSRITSEAKAIKEEKKAKRLAWERAQKEETTTSSVE